jgi:hypothetical protein
MHGRHLTSGEIALAETIFGEAIDYSKVCLFRGKWWPFHPPGVAMAPTGHIWFHPVGGGWSDDFSNERLGAQGYFIHELTHVWQTQQRGRFYLPLMRHPFCRYAYRLQPRKPFSRYGIEQQAEIVRHRFLADRGFPVPTVPPRELLDFRQAQLT